MARRPATLSAYKPTLREQLAILGEKGYTALTGKEPGYEARDLINRYTGLADLLDVPGIALSASDAARSIGTRQYPQAAADVAGLALGAIPIAGPALKGAGKKLVKEGAEAATRLAAKYGADLNAPLRTAATPSIVRSAPTPAEYIEKGSEKHTYVEPSTGSHMSVVTRPTGPRSASVIDLQVPEEHRGTGIGKALQAAVLKDFPSLGGQISSKAAAKNAYAAGRRMAGSEGASLEDIYKAIDENSSVNLWTPTTDLWKPTAPTVEDLASKYGAEVGLPAKPATEDILKDLDAQRDIVSEISKQRETTPIAENLANKYGAESATESGAQAFDPPTSMANKAREKWAATASKAQQFLDSLGYKGDEFRMLAEHAPHAFADEFALQLSHSKVNSQKIADNPQYRGIGLSILQELEASNANLRRHDPSHEYYSHEFFKPSSKPPLSTATADVVPLRRPTPTAKAEGGVVNSANLRYKYGIK